MYRETLKRYLDDLASKRPAPGGGSAAALMGAVGAALLSKVANFTIGKERYKAVQEEMCDVLNRAEVLRENLNKLCSEDAQAYKVLAEALKLPKDTVAEKQERQKKIQEALKQATAVPLQVCKDAHEAIKLSITLAQKGNLNLITDVGIASLMFDCAFQSALLNVKINLNSIKDEQFILGLREVLEPKEREMAAINQEVTTEVEKHLRR